MPDERPLSPATPEDLEHTLAHALRFDGSMESGPFQFGKKSATIREEHG